MTEALIYRLVRHVLDTPFEAFSESDLLAAKKRIIDSMGCALSGVDVAGNDAMLDLVRSWAGAPEAAVLEEPSCRMSLSAGTGCRCRTRR